MSVAKLIQEAKQVHERHALQEGKGWNIFTQGAAWMNAYLNIISKEKRTCAKRPYEGLGFAKYGTSALISLAVLGLFSVWSWWVFPLAVIVFYLVEVHFLFLFPLAIDDKKKLFFQSLQATYLFGYWRAFYFTTRIAAYMLWGLKDLKTPYKKWRIGCLAIVILYQSEIRDRI